MTGPLRLVILVGVAVATTTGLVMGVLRPDIAAGILQSVIVTAREAGVIGWVLLALLQLLIATSGVLPASLLGIAAGAAYGLGLGFLLSAIGTLAGALLAFAISRSIFREMIARQIARRPGMARFDSLLERDGWRIVCLLRISPVMPFAATSYALGMSAIGLRAYTVGTLASLPALLGYVFIGTLADAGLDTRTAQADTLRLFMLAAGAGATLLLTFIVARLARSAIAEQPCEPST